MQARYRKGVGLFVAVVTVVAFLAGCATQAPQLVRYPEADLLPGFSGYFSADVAGNRALFAELLSALEVESEQIVNRTDRITGGFDLAVLGPTDLAAIAYGSFPSGLTQFSLRRNRAFAERTLHGEDAKTVYVQDPTEPDRSALHVFVAQDDVLHLTAGLQAEESILRLDREPRVGRHTLRRSTYSRLIDVGGADGPVATVVFEDPGSSLLGFLGVDAPGVPISDLALSLYESEGEFNLEGELATRSEREAALFSRLSRFFVLLFVRSLGLDAERAQQEVQITVKDNVVAFSNIPVSSEELARVVLRFGGGE